VTAIEEREQLARIDQLLADAAAKQEKLRQLQTIDYEAKLRQYRYEPWKLFATLLTAVAIASGVLGGGLGWSLAHWQPCQGTLE
jgi:hypothetical protein